jgi:hypothetical protein
MTHECFFVRKQKDKKICHINKKAVSLNFAVVANMVKKSTNKPFKNWELSMLKHAGKEHLKNLETKHFQTF